MGDAVRVNGQPFDEWHDREARRCCLEWAMERTPAHATVDDVLSAARNLAGFIYGERDESAPDDNPSASPDCEERVVVPLKKGPETPENERVVGRWEIEDGYVAYATVKAHGAVVSVSRDDNGWANLTVSIGGLDINAPIPPCAQLEIIKILGGDGGSSCA